MSSAFIVIGDEFEVVFPGIIGGDPKTVFQIGNVNGSPTTVMRGDLFADGVIETRALQTGSVTTDILAAGAVHADQISANAIDTSSLIANNVIVSGHLAADAATFNRAYAGSLDNQYLTTNPDRIHGVTQTYTIIDQTVSLLYGTMLQIAFEFSFGAPSVLPAGVTTNSQGGFITFEVLLDGVVIYAEAASYGSGGSLAFGDFGFRVKAPGPGPHTIQARFIVEVVATLGFTQFGSAMAVELAVLEPRSPQGA